MKERKE